MNNCKNIIPCERSQHKRSKQVVYNVMFVYLQGSCMYRKCFSAMTASLWPTIIHSACGLPLFIHVGKCLESCPSQHIGNSTTGTCTPCKLLYARLQNQ